MVLRPLLHSNAFMRCLGGWLQAGGTLTWSMLCTVCVCKSASVPAYLPCLCFASKPSETHASSSRVSPSVLTLGSALLHRAVDSSATSHAGLPAASSDASVSKMPSSTAANSTRLLRKPFSRSCQVQHIYGQLPGACMFVQLHAGACATAHARGTFMQLPVWVAEVE